MKEGFLSQGVAYRQHDRCISRLIWGSGIYKSIHHTPDKPKPAVTQWIPSPHAAIHTHTQIHACQFRPVSSDDKRPWDQSPIYHIYFGLHIFISQRNVVAMTQGNTHFIPISFYKLFTFLVLWNIYMEICKELYHVRQPGLPCGYYTSSSWAPGLLSSAAQRGPRPKFLILSIFLS